MPDIWYPVYTIQPVWQPVGCLFTHYSRLTNRFKPVWQPCWTPCWTNSCSFNRLSNRVVQPVWQPAVYTIQLVVKPVVKWVWQPVECLYTRYNCLSNRFDNQLYRVYKHLTCLTTGCYRVHGAWWFSDLNADAVMYTMLLSAIRAQCIISPNQFQFLIMANLWNRAGHYIFARGFFLLSSFFPSPNLSGRRVDVYHTSTHGVAWGRI